MHSSAMQGRDKTAQNKSRKVQYVSKGGASADRDGNDQHLHILLVTLSSPEELSYTTPSFFPLERK